MYKITDDGTGGVIGVTESPYYIRIAKNGCYTPCNKLEARGIRYNNTTYNLYGRVKLGDFPTVHLVQVDAGTEYASMQNQVDSLKDANEALNARLTEAQLALCDVYEMALGGGTV